MRSHHERPETGSAAAARFACSRSRIGMLRAPGAWWTCVSSTQCEYSGVTTDGGFNTWVRSLRGSFTTGTVWQFLTSSRLLSGRPCTTIHYTLPPAALRISRLELPHALLRRVPSRVVHAQPPYAARSSPSANETTDPIAVAPMRCSSAAARNKARAPSPRARSADAEADAPTAAGVRSARVCAGVRQADQSFSRCSCPRGFAHEIFNFLPAPTRLTPTPRPRRRVAVVAHVVLSVGVGAQLFAYAC